MSDRFNASVIGRAEARRAGGLQVPVKLDSGREALAACLTHPFAGHFSTGRRVLVETDRDLITEVGA